MKATNVYFFLPHIAHAAEIVYDLSTPIPSSGDVAFSDINRYVSAIFSFGVYLAFGLAITIMVYGGARYAASFSSEAQIKGAKEWIFAALAGLLILVTSSLLLNTINPSILTADPLSRLRGVASPDGATPPTQSDGGSCTTNGQCSSGYCDKAFNAASGICKPGGSAPTGGQQDGMACSNDLQCQSGLCDGLSSPYTCLRGSNLPKDASCYGNRQCASGRCSSHISGNYCD